MAERTESVVLDFEVDMTDSIDSIENLTKANKELREARKKLNLDTAEGQKLVQQINAQIDKNTQKIVANSSAIEKQRANIGNYKSALEGVIPGLSNVTSGIEKASKATKLLQAAMGPWGIVLGLISAALALVAKYLFGTQEGMDKVTAVTRPLMAIFDRLTGVLQELGGKVFKQLAEAVTNPIQAIKNLGNAINDNVIARFEALALFGPAIAKIFRGDVAGGFKDLGNAVIQAGTGVENGIDKISNATSALSAFVDEAVAQGQRLDALQKQIERDEINQIKRTKELNFLVKQNKTIVEDATKSFAQREAAALRARTQQNEILSIELNLLDKRIEKLKLQQSLNDTSRADEKELAELEARRFEVQATNAEQSIEFDKKINELRIKNNALLAEQAALERAIARERNQLDATTDDPLTGAFQTQLDNRLQIQSNFDKRIAKQQKEAANEAIRNSNRSAKAQIQIEKNLQETKLNTIAGFLGIASGLFEQESAEYKAFATFQTLISTYSTAQKAYEAAFVPPTVASPALGALNVALAIATGLANLAAINGIQFAEGGWTGPGSKMQVAGVVHADEYVVPKRVKNNPMAQPHITALDNMRLRPYADGGLVASTSTTPVNQQMELANIFKTLPPIEVGVKEISKVQNRVRVKESLSKR